MMVGRMPKMGISVDGGCSGNPGQAYYRAVDIATGEELFRENIGVATNNIAEFLGICHAIYYRNSRGINTTIYSDSRIAIGWVKNRKANTTFEEVNINKRLEKARDYLLTTNYIRVDKWHTKEWGEIPADFGLK